MINVKSKISMICTIFAVSPLFSSSAFAYDWSIDTQVTSIEVTYMPDKINFTIASSIGNCPANSTLTWTPQGSTEGLKIANAQAILSVLMTSRTSGRYIRIYGNNSDCSINFLYFL